MALPILPLLLIVGSGVVYHVAQKAAGSSSSPWPLLALAYAIALLACLVLGWADSGTSLRRVPDRGTLIAGVALGIAVLGVELGFFLAYRAGTPLSSASLLTNLAVTAVLAVIGTTVIGEAMSAQRLAGIGLGAAAAWMMVRG